MKDETSNEIINRVLKGKWFTPILDEIEKLESRNGDEVDWCPDALRDDSPRWSFECLRRGVSAWKSQIADVCPDHFGAREAGKLVGLKWAVISGQARSHTMWTALNPEKIKKIEAVWGAESVAEAISFTRKIRDEELPVMREIKRRAAEEGLQAEIDYTQGFLAGTGVVEETWLKLRAPASKRGYDEKKRQLVLLFGALLGVEIEKEKANLSWPEIAEAVEAMVDDQMEFDEDTVKKILQRTGLSGVGKTGRPVQD